MAGWRDTLPFLSEAVGADIRKGEGEVSFFVGTMIYFIQQGISGPIKIGLSVKPLQRLDTMQTYHASDLIGLGVMSGGRSMETKLHIKFKTIRLAREWFIPRSNLLQYIENNTCPFPKLAKKQPYNDKKLDRDFNIELAYVKTTLGMNARRLGAAIGCSAMTVHRWYSGESKPIPAYRKQLAELLKSKRNGG